MLERIKEFLPQLLPILGIAAATFIYLRIMRRRYRERMKSIKWIAENKWKLEFLLRSPSGFVWVPIVEELIFRAPIIICFGFLSFSAWAAIVGSALAFGLTHYSGKKLTLTEVLEIVKNGKCLTIDQVVKDKKTMLNWRRWSQIILAASMSIISGWLGIKHQSIWLSVGIHAAFNIFCCPILTIMLLLVALLGPSVFALLGLRRSPKRIMDAAEITKFLDREE